MRRGPKPAKSKGAKPPVARRLPKDDGARVRDLEKRLAEALEREAGALTREAEALGKLQTRDRDLTEALEQQTATAEVLELIASSPGDLQPTFDGIVQRARQLCDGLFSILYGLHGELVTIEADDHITPENRQLLRSRFPMAVNQNAIVRRVFLEHRVVHVEDAAADPHFQRIPLQQAVGYRTLLLVPMLREGAVIGAIGVGRVEPGGFTERQVALLQTFADQAVIAIENVRLFKELETRNHDLTTALNQQTATSEILKVISSSPTDAQPVFEAIVRSVQRLTGAYSSSLTRLVDGEQQLTASSSTTPSGDAALRAMYPLRLTQTPLLAQALAKREPSLVEDAEADPRITLLAREIARQRGIRSWLNLPLIHRDSVIGVITVGHAQPRAFTRDDIELLRTFADQAVIAIENVRLFKELEVANRELSAASQHKSEFLANMSHELRTPLNAIIGFSEVLAEKMFGELNEKQEEYSKDIHASGQHLLSLINDILDLSKIEAGRMELELSDFHLPTALDSALTLVRERAGRRSIALHTSIDNRLGQIQADERKVRQVVLNLLSNAIKFATEGGRIEVAAAPRDGSVEVSVSDTGVGIAPEDQEAVFEEFRQVGTADKKVEGTGLGLTLCRKFIELHGGQIWVKSELGAGATFTFSLPLRNA